MSDIFAYWGDYLSWLIPNMFGSAQPHMWFYMLSIVTLVGAWGVVSARNLVHAAMLLALVFVAIAGIFILLNAEFLAAIQVLVYAGGIVTLIIFAIMLSESITGQKAMAHNRQSVTALGVSVMMALVMIAILIYDQNGYFVGPSRWAIPMDRNEFPVMDNTTMIGRSLMSTYTLAFWIASIILMIALIGALIISRKEDKSVTTVEAARKELSDEPAGTEEIS